MEHCRVKERDGAAGERNNNVVYSPKSKRVQMTADVSNHSAQQYLD